MWWWATRGTPCRGQTIALIAGGPLVLLSGGFAFVGTVQMILGIEPFDTAILGLWAMFFVVSCVLLAALGWGWHRRRTVRTAIDSLASSLQGYRLDGVKDTAWWLNTYWAGSYPNETLVKSDYHGAVSAVVDGYRTLVEFSPEADRYHRARLHVLVAAWLPLVTDGTGRPPAASAQASAAHRALVETGFSVEQNAGGLMLRATPAALETLCKKPSRVAEMGRVVQAAVLMARGVGAEPV